MFPIKGDVEGSFALSQIISACMGGETCKQSSEECAPIVHEDSHVFSFFQQGMRLSGGGMYFPLCLWGTLRTDAFFEDIEIDVITTGNEMLQRLVHLPHLGIARQENPTTFQKVEASTR
jgi:hypothetical protein